MKNPWKRLSKINPQREDGTRQINSDVLCALVKAKLPTAEMSVILIIISKTWGFNKTSDTISTSQFAEESGFPGRTIKRIRQELLNKRMIYFRASKRVIRGTPLNEYSFNKHYDTWIIQNTKKGVTSSTGAIRGKKGVSPETPTIETITIEKKIYNRVVDYLNAKTGKNFKSSTPKTKSLIDARVNEKYKPEDFKTVIDNKVACYKLGDFEFKYLRPETLFGSKFEGYLNESCKPVNGVSEHIKKTPEQVDKEIEDALL